MMHPEYEPLELLRRAYVRLRRAWRRSRGRCGQCGQPYDEHKVGVDFTRRGSRCFVFIARLPDGRLSICDVKFDG
jgi:hypothetical protein